jgi:hypothetical protein
MRLAALSLLIAYPLMAQPVTERLPLGLDHFYWRMPFADAVRQFPSLGPKVAMPPKALSVDQRRVRINPYKWRDCMLDVSFSFAKMEGKEQLAGVSVQHAEPWSSACIQELKGDLTKRYGKPTWQDEGGSAIWDTPESLKFRQRGNFRLKGTTLRQRQLERAGRPWPLATINASGIALMGRGMPAAIVLVDPAKP